MSFVPAPIPGPQRLWPTFLCQQKSGGDMGMEIDIEKVGLVQCFGCKGFAMDCNGLDLLFESLYKATSSFWN